MTPARPFFRRNFAQERLQGYPGPHVVDDVTPAAVPDHPTLRLTRSRLPLLRKIALVRPAKADYVTSFDV